MVSGFLIAPAAPDLPGPNTCGTGILPVTPVTPQPPPTPTGLPQGAIHIRRGAYLPHWTREGATYAVTLADSLPAHVLAEWQAEREALAQKRRAGDKLNKDEQRRLAKLFSEKVEAYLDAGQGACFLRDERIAKLVRDALFHFHGQRYELIAWCIMPNYVHGVVRPLAGWRLPQILHTWKSFTAKEANRILQRGGEFWQPVLRPPHSGRGGFPPGGEVRPPESCGSKAGALALGRAAGEGDGRGARGWDKRDHYGWSCHGQDARATSPQVPPPPERAGGARLLAVVTLKPGQQGRQYRLPTERDYEAVWKAQERLRALLEEWEQDPSPHHPSPTGRGSKIPHPIPLPVGEGAR